MLSKVHLTSHSSMSGSRWVITPSWLFASRRSLLYIVYIVYEDLFCVLLPRLLNIFCFYKVHTIPVLYCAHLCMKCSLGISNFLEEISNLSHSIVFLYLFALITEEGFLISACYLEVCIQMNITFLFFFAFSFSLFLSYLYIYMNLYSIP